MISAPERTLVHTEETSAHRPREVPYRQWYELKHPEGILEAVQLYLELDRLHETHKTENLFACRTRAWFTREVTTNQVRVISNACRLRWCPFCQAAKAKLVSMNTAAWLKGKGHPKLLTLTLKHSDAPLDFQIKSLYGFFKSLRRSKLWKSLVRGGVWFFQLTRPTTTNQWHPHLHVLLDSDFIPVSALSDIWQEITSSSFVVDVRAIWTPDTAASHVARYVARPADLSKLEMPDKINVIEATKGLHLAGTFGNAKGVRLTNQKVKGETQFVKLGSWSQLLAWAQFDENALHIVEAWQTGEPIPEDCNCQHIDDFINDAARWTDLKFTVDPPPPLLFT